MVQILIKVDTKNTEFCTRFQLKIWLWFLAELKNFQIHIMSILGQIYDLFSWKS